VSRPQLEGSDACQPINRSRRQLTVVGKRPGGQCQDRSWRVQTPEGLWTEPAAGEWPTAGAPGASGKIMRAEPAGSVPSAAITAASALGART
jgi:hypothetical protein